MAVRDCCLARPNLRVPSDVPDQLAQRIGLDPDVVNSARKKQRLEILIRNLESEEPADRAHAARQLRAFGVANVDYIPTLTRILQGESDPRVHEAIVQALSDMGSVAKPALPALFALLESDESHGFRPVLASAVSEIGVSTTDIPLLTTLVLKDENPAVRYYAVKALGRIGSGATDAVPALLEASMKDSDHWVRDGAAKALSQIAAIPVLMELLRDGDVDARASAAKAIGSLGYAAILALPILERLVLDRSMDFRVRLPAILAISSLGEHAIAAAEASLLKVAEQEWNSVLADAIEKALEKIEAAKERISSSTTSVG